MRKKVIFVVAMAMFFLTVNISSADSSLPDPIAKALLEAVWNNVGYRIPCGAFNVIGGFRNTVGVHDDYQRREITESRLQELKAWEAQGIIKVTKVEYDKGSMKQFSDLTSGVVMKVKVTPTSKGLSLEQATGLPKQNGFLVLRDATYSITKIIKNEGKNVGVNEYRVVMFTFTALWSPEFKTIRSSLKLPPLQEVRKAMVLLKYDPFEGWKIAARDVANQNEEFNTHYVNDIILGKNPT